MKYIYTEKGQQEAVIIPIDFWNDLCQKFDLKDYLEKENSLLVKYSENLKDIDTKESAKDSDFYSLFGSWQSDKTGDEINDEIYSARNDKPKEIVL